MFTLKTNDAVVKTKGLISLLFLSSFAFWLVFLVFLTRLNVCVLFVSCIMYQYVCISFKERVKGGGGGF
mgnify:CR=1 FL=1